MNLRIVQVLALLCLASASAASDPPDLRSAVFAVSCYDVGKQALTGLPGVQDVSTGWRNGQEVNLVRYDPGAIGLLEMEKALRRAQTYVGTLGTE